MRYVYHVALGSNMSGPGNKGRVYNLNKAIKILHRSPGISVQQTSFLYSSRAKYVLDQPAFINAVCRVEAELEPFDMLHKLKSVEKEVGRTETFRHGPRVLDLDILFAQNDQRHIILRETLLSIPHIAIQEREFVLRPLLDIAPELIHPTFSSTISEMWSQLTQDSNFEPVSQVLPFSSMCDSVHILRSRTLMMGILNVTPDSFTDGNQYIDLQKAVDHAKKMVTDGADIVDVGGYSTRPFADDVSVAEELDRVIPVIHSIRKEMPNCVISIDTFRSEVARNAVKFGASIINDISGGLLDNDMFQTASDLCVPIVIMHYRGTPKTMTKFIQYENVLIDVRNHLESRIQAATASGIPRWNIILDPGLGFAKTAEQSLRILRSFSQVLPINFPSLCGPSRKGFIGAITGKQIPSERDWGTSAAISACISGGADIVRVHNVHHLQDCLLVSDAIYRPPVVPDP